MHVPAHFEESDVAVLHALIRSHPLGAWVMSGGRDSSSAGLVANHIPFLIDPSRGAFGTLIGHVARSNPVWKQLSPELSSLVIFQGAEHYISPSWYPTKAETGKVVPTWNYVVVHAHGVPALFDDPDRLLTHVTELTATHESGFEAPWHVADAPAGFVESLLKGIVGIEIPIATLTGKWKVSQNRSEADRRAVVDELRKRDDDRARHMAELVDRADRAKAR